MDSVILERDRRRDGERQCGEKSRSGADQRGEDHRSSGGGRRNAWNCRSEDEQDGIEDRRSHHDREKDRDPPWSGGPVRPPGDTGIWGLGEGLGRERWMTSDGPRMENSPEAEAQRDPRDTGDDERDEGKAEGPAVSGCPRLSRSEDEEQSEGQEAGPEDHEGSDPCHPV